MLQIKPVRQDIQKYTLQDLPLNFLKSKTIGVKTMIKSFQTFICVALILFSVNNAFGANNTSQQTILQCIEKDNNEIDSNGNKALRYLIRKNIGLDKKHVCIERIDITEKIVITGNTIVTYVAHLMFPYGHRTECIKKGENTESLKDSWNWNHWSKSLSCATTVLGKLKPFPIGHRVMFSGEEEI